MKKIVNNFILLFVFFMITGCDELVYKGNDLDELHLTGSVKQLKENDYKGVGKERTLLTSSIRDFNENGNVVSDYRYKGKKLDYNVTCKYNKDGKIATKRIYQGDSIILQLTWTYDKQRLVKFEDAKKNGFIETTSYFYDDNGNCIKKLINSTWVMDKTLIRNRFVENLYDESNRCVEMKEYTDYDNDTIIKYYEYNNNGNLVVEKIVNANGSKQMKRMKYYRNGIMKEEKLINGFDDEISEIKYFDQRGNLQKIEYYGNKILQSKKVFEYKYDDKGNWIMMTTLANGEPMKMTERVILYN